MRRVWAAFAACLLKRHNVFHGGSFCSHGQESYRSLTRVARRQLPPPHISRCFTAPRQKSRTAFVSPLILAVPSLRSLRLLPGVPSQTQGVICNTPQVFAGCSRMCLRLLFAAQKCGRSPRSSFMPQPKITDFRPGTPISPHAKNHRFFPRGPRFRFAQNYRVAL